MSFGACSLNFNSTMVRLKVCYAVAGVAPGVNFNSTMVRLKEIHQIPAPPHISISIPLWYD